jgi:multidrug resistance protein MdtO
VGASRQKQVLRFAGALIGGFGIGMTAQVFILPYIDSIGAFTVFFAIVAAGAAWIATSSPRLSYLGVQIIVAFGLINLQEFKIQTSLAVARDRIVGILLGLFMMWLFFDQLWSAPAGVEMRRTFISGLRLLAQLAREPVSADIRAAIERSYSLREAIQAHFDKVRSLADGVLFEFGPSRQKDLGLRAQIRKWQPQLRAIFIMRLALWKYRVGLPGFELPEGLRDRQRAYDERSAQILEELADRVETNGPRGVGGLESSQTLLQSTLQEIQAEDSGKESYKALLRNVDTVTTSLATEIALSL